MKMKKAIIAGLLTMATSGIAFAAGTPGQQIGTGSMTVTGSVGASTCTVSFPSSLNLPAIEASTYNSTPNQSAIVRQPTEGVTFTDCPGETVKVRIDANSSRGQSGNVLRVAIPGDDNKTFVGLQLVDGNNVGYTINADDPKLSNISIQGNSHNIPVEVKAMRWSSASLPSSVAGQFDAVYTFTATYQ